MNKLFKKFYYLKYLKTIINYKNKNKNILDNKLLKK